MKRDFGIMKKKNYIQRSSNIIRSKSNENKDLQNPLKIKVYKAKKRNSQDISKLKTEYLLPSFN